MDRFIAEDLAARNGVNSIRADESSPLVPTRCLLSLVTKYKEFLQLYNKLTQNCFIACVTNLNYRKVTTQEESCIDTCSTKWMNLNQRQMAVFMEVGPLADKKMGHPTGQGL